MSLAPQTLLVAAVVTVGIAHTMVPDHWVPIAVIARRDGWSRTQTARAAAIAGLGHTASTLAIGALVWVAGVALATRFGHLISLLSSIALIAFGVWIAAASWLEQRRLPSAPSEDALPRSGSRMTLLLILGSSPMVEGIPAFFAASRFGAPLLLVMAACFAASTIATYVALCVSAGAVLQRLRLGRLERYGEIISGTVIAVVGAIFLVWPLA